MVLTTLKCSNVPRSTWNQLAYRMACWVALGWCNAFSQTSIWRRCVNFPRLVNYSFNLEQLANSHWLLADGGWTCSPAVLRRNPGTRAMVGAVNTLRQLSLLPLTLSLSLSLSSALCLWAAFVDCVYTFGEQERTERETQRSHWGCKIGNTTTRIRQRVFKREWESERDRDRESGRKVEMKSKADWLAGVQRVSWLAFVYARFVAITGP